MLQISTPQFRCLAAVGRCDITPPVGIYHRMWGAALHDRSTGTHRPLTATVLILRSVPGEAQSSASVTGCVLVSLDHCILETSEMDALRDEVAEVTGVHPNAVFISLTHTHGSGWMSKGRAEFPGGELIAPYLQQLRQLVRRTAEQTLGQLVEVSGVCGTGRCNLATHRDFFDARRGHAVCGFNPEGRADDAVTIARLTTDDGHIMATVVNYACHPTTLAWDNTLVSPDWVGSMRETVEQHVGGKCLFLQGASGDLGPREGFVGKIEVAERNGRQLGFAVLSALQTFPAPSTRYVYQGPVLSGTWIGTWAHVPVEQVDRELSLRVRWESFTVPLQWRHDLPTIEDTQTSRERWLKAEQEARETGDEVALRTSRANAEQMTRQLTRLQALGPGRACAFPVRVGLLGSTLWVFVPGELYQVFQKELRRRFPDYAVFVTTLTGDWQPGYVPPASGYGYGIYQEVIAATAPGSLEVLIEETSRFLLSMLDKPRQPMAQE